MGRWCDWLLMNGCFRYLHVDVVVIHQEPLAVFELEPAFYFKATLIYPELFCNQRIWHGKAVLAFCCIGGKTDRCFQKLPVPFRPFAILQVVNTLSIYGEGNSWQLKTGVGMKLRIEAVERFCTCYVVNCCEGWRGLNGQWRLLFFAPVTGKGKQYAYK